MSDNTQVNDGNINSPSKSLGPFTRVLARLGGANPDQLAGSPREDVMVAVRTGLALMASHLFISGALFCGLTVAIGQGQSGVMLIGAAAILVATIIVLVDHAMIQTSWTQGGEDHLRHIREADAQREANPDISTRSLSYAAHKPFSRFLRNLALFGFRVVLSVALAFTVATVLELVIFERDIARRLETERVARNAPLIAEMEERVGTHIKRLDERARSLAQTLTVARAEEVRLSAQLAELEHSDSLQRAAQRAKLEQARAAALDEVQRRRADAIAEKQGVRETSQNSGIRGEGSRFRNATAQAEAQTERAAELLGEMARLETPSQILATSREQLAEKRQKLLGLEALETASRTELTMAIADRVPSANAMAGTSEGYSTPRDGLLLRLETLHNLKQDSAALASFALGLKLVLMLAEMGGLVSKLLASGASVHAVRTALTTETGIACAMAEAESAMARHTEGRDALRSAIAARSEQRSKDQLRDKAAKQARDRFQRLLDDALGPDAPRQ